MIKTKYSLVIPILFMADIIACIVLALFVGWIAR